MAQLIPGVTYATGDAVTASNLNAHVSGAQLTAGAIAEQTVAATVGGADSLLVLQSGFLKQGTVNQLLDNASLPSYVKIDGTRAMTSELTLSSAAPAGTLSAVPKTYVDAALAPLVPTGAIMPFYRNAAPSGWAKCDGTTIPISTETAALRALIAPATTYPNLQGEFIRGLDQTRGVDPGRTVGDSQAQDVQPHSHTYNAMADFQGGSPNVQAGVYDHIVGSYSATTGNTGTKETRPRNVAFLYCIKL